VLDLLIVAYAVCEIGEVQESLYRPFGDRRGVQEFEAPYISRYFAHEVGQVASPTYSFLVLIFARADLNPGP